jgi:signal transduction histidine kinase
MFHNLPLTEKLVLYFILLGMLVVGMLGSLTYFSARKAILDRTFNQLTSVRVMRGQQIQSYVSDRRQEAEMLAKSRWLVDMAMCLEKEMPGEMIQCQGRFQNALLPSAEDIPKILLITENQRIYCIDRVMNDSLYRCPEEGSLGVLNNTSAYGFRDLVQLADGSYYMLITARISKGRILALALPVAALDKILLENDPLNGLGYSGECYIVGPDSLMRSSSRFHQPSVLITPVNTQAVRRAFSEGSGTVITKDYRDIQVLSAYGKLDIAGLDWVILAEIDLAETMQPILRLRNSILGMSIVISLVMFIIAYFSARWISRPLRLLEQTSREIGEGHLDARVSVKGSNEFSHLAESFNTMAERIMQQQAELGKERTRQFELTLDGQELERQRLSRELHDGLGQSLVALKLKLEQVNPQNTCEAFATIKSVKTSLDETIDNIRSISNNLMPGSLQVFGLGPALRKLCLDTEENAGLKVVLQGEKLSFKIDPRVSLYIFRIVQEALTNIIRHSGARLVWITFTETSDRLILEIRDNGHGILDPDSAIGSGQGLYNMRERCRILEGQMKIVSENGEGTRIFIEIPKK